MLMSEIFKIHVLFVLTTWKECISYMVNVHLKMRTESDILIVQLTVIFYYFSS